MKLNRIDLPPPQLALAFVGMLTLLFVQHWGSGGTWPSLDEIPQLVVALFLDGAVDKTPKGRSPTAPRRPHRRRARVRR